MKNTEKKNLYLKNYREKPENKARHRDWMRAQRMRVIQHYGARCVCCGESEIKFLALDHIKGGGNRHRAEINRKQICGWIEKNNFPPIFQILCHNCNQAKVYGECPHSVITPTKSERTL